MKHEILNEQLIRLAFSKRMQIHIILNDGTWRNGFVTKVFSDFFDFKDHKNDVEPFFYIQLKNVEPFTEHKGGRE